MALLDLKNGAALKLLLGGLIAVGMLGVFFATHFLPFSYPVRKERIDALKTEFENKSTELARARASVADLPRFEAEYQQLHDRWIMAAELLPADHEMPALLRKLTLAGEQTGVTFVSFRPGGLRPETYYTEMPIEITVHGDYHQTGAFLAELANMRRIVTVNNLKVTSNDKGDDGSSVVSMTASAYSLNTGNGAGATGATAPKKKGGASDAHKGS
jgi:type IV pilus assembly protein PilO